MGKSSPEPPNYTGAALQQASASKELANQQTQANRPGINTPWASQQWRQGPNGQWEMTTGFNGPTAGAASAIQGQMAQTMGQPLDLSSLGTLGTGDEARKQAVDAAYGQATSRLDPQWQQREDATRTRLLNQGLTEGSEAYRSAMGELGQQRNDAYSSAMNMAIGQGTTAGDSAFRNNMASRQQALAEVLRQRGQPMAEAQALNGLLGMPDFQAAGSAQAPQYLQAAMGQGQGDLAAWQASNQANSDLWGSVMELGGSLYMMSDVRAKRDVVRLPREAMPGVPFATWEYLHEPGRRYLGVIAQDVAAVAPHLVRTGPDGLLRVHPALSAEPIS
jgi:hypothetical protein